MGKCSSGYGTPTTSCNCKSKVESLELKVEELEQTLKEIEKWMARLENDTGFNRDGYID